MSASTTPPDSEKVVPMSGTTSHKKGFLAKIRWNRKPEDKGMSEKSSSDVTVDAKTEEPDPSISLFSLFRFSTKMELCLDAIGVIAAVIAGAAQPLMTLLFGSLSQGFVDFGIALAANDAGDPAAAQLVAKAGAEFRRSSAKNASYLTYLGVGLFACTYIFMHTWTYTGERNAKRIRERYLQSVLRQDISFFDKVGAGEVTTRIENDTHLVQVAISQKVPLSISYISAFITGFVLAYARSWRLALALTSIFPWIVLTGALMMATVGKSTRLSLKHIADAGTVAEEVISTIRTAQAFGTQDTLARKYESHAIQARQADNRSALFTGIGIGSAFFVIYASYSLAFYYGTILLIQGRANVGTIINVGLSLLIGSFSLALLAPAVSDITKGQAAAAKLYATIKRIPAIDSADPGGLKPEKVVGDIIFEDVKFHYPSRPGVEVLRDLSIAFPAGQISAIVGASGSGKSTIVALIERFYDPVSGTVKLDGIDVKDMNLKWLRSQIGFVMQEPTLFSTTVRENVAHGLINSKWEHASDEEKFALIKDACVKANADTFISKLPQGYDTVVGERGILLSGGQKQRVAIARAIVSDPRILLFDEATSALDTQSEGVVQDALDKAAAGRTTITIAHRLSTIKEADQIFVMGEGILIERGTHNELLLNEDGAYSRLVRAQNLRGGAYVMSNSTIDKDADFPPEEGIDDKMVGRSRKATFSSETYGHAVREAMKEKDTNYGSIYLIKRIARLNRESKLEYLIGGLFSMIVGLTHPAYAFVWSKAIKGFTTIDSHSLRQSGDRVALWFFIIAITSTFAISMQNYTMLRASAQLTLKLRTLSFRSILRQDIKFFDKSENNTGTLTSNLTGNPTKISGLSGATLGAIVQSITTLISGIILGLVFSWKISLIGIACIPAVIWAGFAHMWVVVLKDQKSKKAHEHAAHLACEAAGSIRTVAALTREDQCCEVYSKNLEAPLKNASRAAFRGGIIYGLAQAMTFWVVSLIFWYGSRLVSRLEISMFAFFIGLMGVTFGAVQAGNIFAFVPDVSKARGAATAVISLFDSVPEIDADSTSGKDPDEGSVKGRLRLEDVHFRYPTRPEVPVLRGMSIKVEPGTYVAIAGASGSGKSTIIQIAERFYDPWSGEIYLDNEPIPNFNVQSYRKQLALVSQEPTLYAGTVRFNVMLGAIKPEAEVTQEEIESACRQANILEFIQDLPDGFNTEVGGKGSQLSGGQKQRIAIARALMRNPKILLLDEATSALDSAAEKVVQEALDQAATERTTIAIAHRLSTIQNADCIYFIKDGRVSESGTHDQLLARRGDYYEYCQLQALHGG